MTAANRTRRKVMIAAWGFKRGQPVRSFADCLRDAWVTIKHAVRMALTYGRPATGRGTYQRSVINSPTSNRFAGVRYGRTLDRQAGVMISAMGR